MKLRESRLRVLIVVGALVKQVGTCFHSTPPIEIHCLPHSYPRSFHCEICKDRPIFIATIREFYMIRSIWVDAVEVDRANNTAYQYNVLALESHFRCLRSMITIMLVPIWKKGSRVVSAGLLACVAEVLDER